MKKGFIFEMTQELKSVADGSDSGAIPAANAAGLSNCKKSIVAKQKKERKMQEQDF